MASGGVHAALAAGAVFGLGGVVETSPESHLLGLARHAHHRSNIQMVTMHNIAGNGDILQ
ncbi:MAG: hypothetical protein EAZ11_06950 [Curvibacter sp.]|nr:MAG: hypothetical protein EAZ11_06950 [Curvibacter sp.]